MAPLRDNQALSTPKSFVDPIIDVFTATKSHFFFIWPNVYLGCLSSQKKPSATGQDRACNPPFRHEVRYPPLSHRTEASRWEGEESVQMDSRSSRRRWWVALATGTGSPPTLTKLTVVERCVWCQVKREWLDDHQMSNNGENASNVSYMDVEF